MWSYCEKLDRIDQRFTLTVKWSRCTRGDDCTSQSVHSISRHFRDVLNSEAFSDNAKKTKTFNKTVVCLILYYFAQMHWHQIITKLRVSDWAENFIHFTRPKEFLKLDSSNICLPLLSVRKIYYLMKCHNSLSKFSSICIQSLNLQSTNNYRKSRN